jgi:hypothetical protein
MSTLFRMSTLVDGAAKLFYTRSMANTDRDGFAKVLKIYSKAELASHLRLTRAAIYKWGDGIPEGYILKVSMLTGLPPEEIAPQAYRELLKLREKGKSHEKAQR